MKITVGYCSDTLLPEYITDILEETKTDLLKLSREPDKTIILFDTLRKNLVNWIAYHVMENDE